MRYIAIGLSLILLGCSARVEYLEPVKVSYPLPKPVQMKEVTWQVITKETMSEKPDNVVLIGLDWNESLTHRQDLGKLLDYIKKQQVIICKHQKCE